MVSVSVYFPPPQCSSANGLWTPQGNLQTWLPQLLSARETRRGQEALQLLLLKGEEGQDNCARNADHLGQPHFPQAWEDTVLGDKTINPVP